MATETDDESIEFECATCRSRKTAEFCEACEDPLCQKCLQHLDEGRFAFLPKLEAPLNHHRYCPRCYDTHIVPALESYEETLVKAREVTVLTTAYKGHVPLINKAKKPIRVDSCPDRDEAVLRLAFLAVLQGFNALIKCDIVRKKVRHHGYEKSDWSAEGYPASIDEKKHAANEFREETYRRGR